MPVPKGKRKTSKDEFNAILYKINDDAVDMIEHNFRAEKQAVVDHQYYIRNAAKELSMLVWNLIYHIKVANALFPTTEQELIERRIEQEKAIGICFDILTLYEITMHTLRVQEDKGVAEINNVKHQINAIKAWRASDNKRFRDLKTG